ncbi:MAG: TatD DNase family protein [Mariniblastus sp.]|jgi:TatD DNase family protein
MQLFDTHAHLEDEQLSSVLDDVLAKAEAAELVGITAIGTTVSTSRDCLALAEKYEQVFAAVGIHPNHAKETTEQDWQQIVAMASHPQVVAIGETGLDRYWDYCSIETQQNWFARHIELSFETRKPLVVHMRECESDILSMFQSHQRDGRIIGIMHSFAGQWETAQACLELGMYISFAGMVTFKKSDELREIAAKIPEDRILVETDSPYLSPHPHRGKRPNHPAMVRYTAACIAEARGMTVEAFSNLTTKNAKCVFNLTNLN